jgi:hypothetical protein
MGKVLIGASALAIAAALGWVAQRERRGRPHRDALPFSPAPTRRVDHVDPDATGEVTRKFLLYFIVPLWLSAGMADWLCHRASHIEDTGGARESLFHLVMLVEVGVPALAGIFLEITSPVIGLMIGGFVLHEVTSLYDVAYAVTRREVTPIEQHVHSFLELVPLMGLSFVSVLHWSQAKRLFGIGGTAAGCLMLKRHPLPAGYIASLSSALLLFVILPYLEELWRGVAVSRSASRHP